MEYLWALSERLYSRFVLWGGRAPAGEYQSSVGTDTLVGPGYHQEYKFVQFVQLAAIAMLTEGSGVWVSSRNPRNLYSRPVSDVMVVSPV